MVCDFILSYPFIRINTSLVRLGKSGLKVSKIILGCMSYGRKGWREWVIEDEETVFKHIKTAFDAGINVSYRHFHLDISHLNHDRHLIQLICIHMGSPSVFWEKQ